MNSRERVKRAVEFDRPDRVPRHLWTLPIATLTNGAEAMKALKARWPMDIAGIPVSNPQVEALQRGDPYVIGQYRDEWGCTFESIQAGVVGEIKHPLIDDWSKMDLLRPPMEALSIDASSVNAFCAASDQFILGGCCARPFERLQFLRGSENLYMDLAEESSDFEYALKVIHDFFVAEMEVWSKTNVDGLMFMDDWGSQRSLLISPAQWRRVFKPLYAQYAQVAHAAGKKLFMHSDGFIFDVYEDLIEIGIDAINSQLFCMDIEEIGRRFGGRITFWGEIDRQHVMHSGTVEDVRAAVARVIKALYRPEGGVIAQFELGADPLANADAAFQRWAEVGNAANRM